MSAALELLDVTFRYGAARALDAVSISIPEGRCVALIGPNGAGKTTALSLWSGFLHATSGSVLVAGASPGVRPGALAALPQDAALPAATSLGASLTLLAKLSGEGAPRQAAQAALARVGLSDSWNKSPTALSHGMAKRAALAQALFGTPSVMLFDEPTAGLDPRAAAEMRTLLASLRAERTLVISSHQLSELESLCDHVIVLDKGRVAFSGPLENLTSARAELRIDIAKGAVPLPELRRLADVSDVQLSPSGMLVIRHQRTETPELLTRDVLRLLFEHEVLVRSVNMGQGLEAGVLALPSN